MEYWHFNPVSVIYFAATGISLLLAYFGWRVRTVRGATLFSILMIFVSVWILGYMLGIYTNNFQFKLWFFRIEYIGLAGAIYMWPIFVARYTQIDQWLNRWVCILLAIIPVFTVVSVFRAPNDTAIRTEYIIETVKGISFFAKNYSWGFYLWIGYSYTLLATGVVLLMVRMLMASGSVKKQLITFLPIVLIVFLPNVLFVVDHNFIHPYDPTPIALVLVGIIMMINIYLFKFLDVVPVAHDTILKNVKSGIVIVDSRTRIIEINKVALEIIGKSEKLVLGKTIYTELPETKGIVRMLPVVSEIKTEVVLGQGKRHFELTVNPLSDETGNVFGQVIMMWDITDQKMAMSELDAYARTVAHDLKSPLGHIMGFAKLLGNGEIPEIEANAYVRQIVLSGEKMCNIVDGLLMLAKIRNLDMLEVKPINMEKVVASVCQRLSDQIDKKDVELLLPNTWESAMGNAIWIEEVWVNLVSNAIKYGGTPPKVELGYTPNGASVKYWVKDNGQGLSKQDQTILFNEFSRIHPRKDSIKGHGLGLSIVQRVVAKLKGEVGVESTVGLGSTFYFSLPKF